MSQLLTSRPVTAVSVGLTGAEVITQRQKETDHSLLDVLQYGVGANQLTCSKSNASPGADERVIIVQPAQEC